MLITLLLLSILMIGSVSASDENITDALAVEDDSNDGIMESNDENTIDVLIVEDSPDDGIVESNDENITNALAVEDDSDEVIAKSNDGGGLLGVTLNGGTLQEVAQTMMSSPEYSVIYLNGATYTGTGTVSAQVRNIWIHGGRGEGDSMMATFTTTTMNFALLFQQAPLNNVTFENIRCDGSLFRYDYNYFPGTIENCRFINCEITTDNPYGAFMFSQANLVNFTFENVTCVGRLMQCFSGSMTDCQFVNCESVEHFVIWTGDAANPYRVQNCTFINCSQTNTTFEDGHGQFAAGLGVQIDGCNFINTSSGQHGGAICISDESEFAPGNIASSITNTNFIGVSSKWFAVYIHGRFATSTNVLAGHEVIENCTFIDCIATEGYGAGLGISHNDVLVKNCTFINNIGGQGSAIMIGGISNDNGNIGDYAFSGDNTKGNNITIIGCTFLDCNAYVHDCPWIDQMGNTQPCQSSGYGGAVYIFGNETAIINCSFENNVATEGGAIYFYSRGYVFDCNFVNCSSIDSGGAIYFKSEGTVYNCSFMNCSSFVDYGSTNGGAIYIYTSGNLIDCSFMNCSSVSLDSESDGGAIYISGSGNLTNCSFENCSSNSGNSYDYGGAVYIYNFGNFTDCSFVDCSVNSDAFTSGGAVHIESGSGVFTNCSFANCSTNWYHDGNGGAISIFNGFGNFIDCSFDNCSSDEGGAVYIYGDGDFTNCSFAYCSPVDEGGAVYIYGDANFTYCNFVNCFISSSYGDSNGGAIYILGSCNVIHCSFVDCYSEYGGAVYISGSASIFDCIFEGCSSYEGSVVYISDSGNVTGCSFEYCYSKNGNGGAICFDGYGNVDNCNFMNCSSKFANGGAIYFADLGNVTNSVFTNCSAVKGGAIYSEKFNVLVLGSEFIKNTATLGGAMYQCTFENCVLEGNSYPDAYPLKAIINVTVEDNQYKQTTRIIVNITTNATGSITLSLSNKKGISNLTSPINEGIAVFEVSDLPVEVYNMSVYYPGDYIFAEAWKNTTFSVLPIINMPSVIAKGFNGHITMEFGNVTGYVNFYVDDEDEYDAQLRIKNGKVNYTLSTELLSIGNHTLKFEYVSGSIAADIFKYSNKTYDFSVDDGVVPAQNASTKYFEVHLEPDATGTVDFFINGVKCAVSEIVNGVAKLDISNLKNGDYIITWRYSGDDKYSPYGESYKLIVNNKPAKIVAYDFTIVYTSTNKYSVKVYDAKGKLLNGVQVSFLINNKAYKSVKTNVNGIASIIIDKIPGSYKITAKSSGISITKKLKVNHVLTIKKVKVKRSAKKLVIKTNLKKVNGKYLKGKKITLKFKGKKFKAKTNKKGVAKFTIKSKVLKKLKVGKKVKYQATYLKDTVKKSVKVKK